MLFVSMIFSSNFRRVSVFERLSLIILVNKCELDRIKRMYFLFPPATVVVSALGMESQCCSPASPLTPNGCDLRLLKRQTIFPCAVGHGDSVIRSMDGT